jgi:hypothetical protein
MDKLIKAISSAAPFLAPYPLWVKGSFVLWVLATAVLLIGLVLGKPESSAPVAAENPASTPDPMTPGAGEPAAAPEVTGGRLVPQPPQARDNWLVIEGVEFFAAKPGAQIRLTADVNGTRFTYPSNAGVEWLEVGPGMASQVFPLPPADRRYVVRFEALVRVPASDQQPQIDGELRSVNEHIVDSRSELPHSGRYILHTFDPVHRARSASAEAQVRYRISDRPR